MIQSRQHMQTFNREVSQFLFRSFVDMCHVEVFQKAFFAKSLTVGQISDPFSESLILPLSETLSELSS